MMQLFVEGYELDISESISALLTFSIDDIRPTDAQGNSTFASKNSTFSKTIVLPGTKLNNAFFGNIFDVSAANDYDPAKKNANINFNPAVSASAYIFNDNIQCFKGILRLMQVNNVDGMIDYEVVVFGELGGLISALNNKKLEELDFSAYDHVYNETNIENSWDNDNGGSGYYYPLTDYGTYSTGKHDWKIGTFRPALFAKEYLDKMFEAAGYTYTSALFSTDRFLRQIIPHNQKVLSTATSLLLTASRATNQTVISYATTNTARLNFPTFSGGLFTPDATPANRFTYTGAAILTTVDFSLAYNYLTNSNTIAFELQKNGSVIASKTIPNIGGATLSSGWSDSVNVSLTTGDYLEFWVTVSSSITNYSFTFTSGTLTINAAASIPVPISYGDTVTMNDSIPKNILQVDFFSWIVKLFNLYVYEDQNDNKTLKIEPFIDFFASASSEDWSSKIDRSKAIKVKPMSELNAKFYEFNFKSDSDYYNDLYTKRYNQTYGSYIYDSQYEFAVNKQTCEIGFSGTVLVGYGGEDKVYSTIFKSSNGNEETIDSNIRILQARKITGVSSWALKNAAGSSTYASYTKYGYAGHLDDPDNPANDNQFGVPKELFFALVTGALNVNQFNVYWSAYMAEITNKDSRLVTCTAKLDYKDIYNLDFSKYKYVDGNLFRLNKIVDFNTTKEDTCTVELIKLISKIY